MGNGYASLKERCVESEGLVITPLDIRLRAEYDSYVDNPEIVDPNGTRGKAIADRVFARCGHSREGLNKWLKLTGNGNNGSGKGLDGIVQEDEEIAKKFEAMPVRRQLTEAEIPDNIKGTYDDPRIRWLMIGQRMAVPPKHNRESYLELFKKLTDLCLPLRDYENMSLRELKDLAIETGREVSREIINRCSPEQVASLRSYIYVINNGR